MFQQFIIAFLGRQKEKIWRRLDHANINLIIAGSYTPFAITLLAGKDRAVLLWVIWLGALAGVAIRVFGFQHRVGFMSEST